MTPHPHRAPHPRDRRRAGGPGPSSTTLQPKEPVMAQVKPASRTPIPTRKARNGTLIIGGGFGGAHVARLLGKAGATIVNPDASMLYTPLLPEVAAGAIEPRHAVVPCGRCARMH